jgi:ATP-dependent exoDNAse (exonuclease V) beta subunit
MRRGVRKQAKQVMVPVVNPSLGDVVLTEVPESDVTSAQRLFGGDEGGERAKVSELTPAATVEAATLMAAVSASDAQLVQSPGGAAPSDAGEPAAFGRYVHEILSRVDLSGRDLEKVAATLARQQGMGDADRRKAAAMVDRVLRLPLMDEARAATRLFREVPLAATAPGGHVQGRADLLFESGGRWRLIEFKTDQSASTEAVHEHSKQLVLYAARLSALVSRSVRPSVCFVRPAQVVEY